MAFDTKKWLLEDLGFSEQEATDLLPKFEGERAGKVEKGYLRQADYSKQMNAAKKAEADLLAASERLNAEMAQWATMTATERAQSTELRASLEAAQQDVLKYRQTVERVAAEAGMDPAKVLEGMTVPVKKEEPKPPTVDLTGYVKADQLSGLADMMLTLPAELAAIANEHQTLTGVVLDQRALIAVDTAMNSPLLDVDVSTANRALINVTGGEDMTLKEAELIVSEVSKRIDPSSHIIWGARIEKTNKKSCFRAKKSLIGRPTSKT